VKPITEGGRQFLASLEALLPIVAPPGQARAADMWGVLFKCEWSGRKTLPATHPESGGIFGGNLDDTVIRNQDLGPVDQV
jgi:hypothetical protein